jgi:DNA-binding NtrC family response regulator
VKPFVALVDIRVKGGGDGEALRTVLAQNPGLPVLAMTAFPDAKHVVETIRVFEKPFQTGKLLDAIETVHEDSR